MNIIVAFIITVMSNLNAAIWSNVSDEIFNQVFGLYNVAFFVSILACYISQILDITIFLWLRTATQGHFLWLRSFFSSGLSLFIDTLIVITFMSIFGALPTEKVKDLIFNSYQFKLLFSLLEIPIFYFLAILIKAELGK